VSQPAPIFLRRVDDPVPRLMGALGLALAAHASFVALVGIASHFGWLDSKPVPKPPEQVALVTVSSSQWSANRSIPDPTAPQLKTAPKPPSPEQVKKEAMPKGQIVDVQAGNDQKPVDAKYLADHDNTVAKETRAREQSQNYKHAMAQKTTPVPAEKSLADPGGSKGEHGNGGKAKDTSAMRDGSHAGHFEIPTNQPRPELAMAETEPHGEIHNQNQLQQKAGNAPRLLVTPGELSKINDDAIASEGHYGREGEEATPARGEQGDQAGAPSNDRLDLPEGSGTWLNTREFRYAQFFNRIKQRVSEQWNVDSVLHRRDPRGSLVPAERVTLLGVVLDTQGRIADIQVVQSSGVTFLDEEAVAAFQRAQPFPNPPPALFDDNGQMKFAFGFYIEPGHGGGGFRVYRNRD